MLPHHRAFGSVALSAAAEYGFVLAGGYALAEHGIGDRLSEDVDLFSNVPDPARFARAVAAVRTALVEAGYSVDLVQSAELFARLLVNDGTLRSELDLGVDYRQFPPATLAIGPVLSLADAAGSKLVALYSRGEPRDYLDVWALLRSRRFTPSTLLKLADQRESEPLDRRVLINQLRAVSDIAPARFESYGAGADEVRAVVSTMTKWAADVAADVTRSRIIRTEFGPEGPAPSISRDL